MRSIRTKIILLAISIAVITSVVATVIGTISIKKLGDDSSEQILHLLCRTGEENLNHYFKSVEQSVATVSDLVTSDINTVGLDELEAHAERVRDIFNKSALQTYGVLTYYYRIDPLLSDTVKGFWYTNLDGNGFVEHEVTDITLYDLRDTSKLVWFTVPMNTGKPVWLPPYITDNLDQRVISYNVPIYCGTTFVGVVGIEIDYSTMAFEVDNIKLYDNGYAFINDTEGHIIYHPYIDVMTLSEEERPEAPEELVSEASGNIITYHYGGVKKHAVWLPLSNGMRLNVTVPVSEINNDWQRMVAVVVLVSVGLLLLFVILTMRFSERITKPLSELTEAAEQVDKGNYDVMLNYSENDEVGVLSRTMDRLIAHLKVYINDLNSRAHTDALTAVRNKSAYDIYTKKLQQRIDDPEDPPRFAIAIFDCDDLKLINDRYGHDKGDLYLKNTSAMICHVFTHSSVYRIGGDEFAVILKHEDYRNRDALLKLFQKKCAATCVKTNEWWDQLRISVGMADYIHLEDRTVEDVARRADKLMYENKHERKSNARNNPFKRES